MTSSCNTRTPLVLMGLAVIPEIVLAGNVDYSVSLASDYLFNGISQTNMQPALQAQAAYSAGTGLYGEIWASTVDLSPEFSADIEINYSIGFISALTANLELDLGVTRIDYFGNSQGDLDAAEVYSSLIFQENTAATLVYSQATAYYGETLSLQLRHGKNLGQNTMLNFQSTLVKGQGDENLSLIYGIGVLKKFTHFDIEFSFQDNNFDSTLISGRQETQNFVFNLSLRPPLE